MSETVEKHVEPTNQADDDTEIVVEVDETDDNGTETIITAEKTDEKPVKKVETSASVDETLAQIKARLADETAARQHAERQAQEAQRRAQEAVSQVDEANLRAIEGAISQIKSESANYKARYAAAAAAGDFAEVAELQEAIAANAAKVVQLEQGKAALESRPKTQPKQAEAQIDPVEAFASALDARGAAWIRAHPQFARDQRQYQRLAAAHNLALGDGIREGSDEYYDAIETTLRLRRAEPQERQYSHVVEDANVARKPTPPAAAPVSRGERSNVIRLTATQKATAEAIGMTVEEYAKNLAAARKAGKIS